MSKRIQLPYIFLMFFTLICLLGLATKLLSAPPSVTFSNLPNEVRQVLDQSYFYNNKTMPPAFQIGRSTNGEGQNRTRFSDVMYDVSAERSERIGNANREFPWHLGPGGTHSNERTGSIKSIYLPKQSSGEKSPILVFKTQVPTAFRRGSMPGWNWLFPKGTRIFEFATVRHLDKNLTFEVRERERRLNKWVFAVYKPVPTRADLYQAVKDFDPQQAESILANLENNSQKLSNVTLADTRNRTKQAFKETANLLYLSKMEPALVHSILTKSPFIESLGVYFDSDETEITTMHDNQIIPPKYSGAMIHQNCNNCHQDILQPARKFDRRRAWYGLVRGGDQIFSFNPVSKSAIGRGSTKTVRFRKDLVDAGIIRILNNTEDPNQINPRVYRRI